MTPSSIWSSTAADDTRQRLLKELTDAGFRYKDGVLLPPRDLTKEGIRKLYARQRTARLAANTDFLNEWEESLLERFAEGEEVDPAAIDPEVTQVSDDEEAALFKFATLQWSVPVSNGFGRRTRFLVTDRQNGCLIGVFALGDPVYNLTARDQVIGWNAEQRSERLYNVLDAFILGAVPPYRNLIGGKLVAMAAVSDQVLKLVRKKYEGRVTSIQEKAKDPTPVLITTTSALGRSSIYNRLKYKTGDKAWELYQRAGYTRGYGHFQFSEELFEELRRLFSKDGGVPSNRFGSGPNWRMRTLRTALQNLNLDPELLHHGVGREVFLAPLAGNWTRYLRGEAIRRSWYHFDLDDMGRFFRERWAISRAERDPSYRAVRRTAISLSRELPA